MLRQIARCIERHAQERLGGKPDPQRMLVLDDSSAATEGCIALVFGEDPEFPAIVAKAARIGRERRRGGRPINRIEHENLERLEREGLNAERRTTPAPLRGPGGRGRPGRAATGAALRGSGDGRRGCRGTR